MDRAQAHLSTSESLISITLRPMLRTRGRYLFRSKGDFQTERACVNILEVFDFSALRITEASSGSCGCGTTFPLIRLQKSTKARISSLSGFMSNSNPMNCSVDAYCLPRSPMDLKIHSIVRLIQEPVLSPSSVPPDSDPELFCFSSSLERRL